MTIEEKKAVVELAKIIKGCTQLPPAPHPEDGPYRCGWMDGHHHAYRQLSKLMEQMGIWNDIYCGTIEWKD